MVNHYNFYKSLAHGNRPVESFISTTKIALVDWLCIVHVFICCFTITWLTTTLDH